MFFNDKKKKLSKKDFDKEVEALVEFVRTSVSPFDRDTKEKQEKRVRRARASQDFFNQTYLPHYFTQPGAPFHNEIEALAEEGERQHRPVAVAAPRGHAKSTRFTLARPLKKIVFKEKKFIAVVTGDDTLTAGVTVSIRTELEHNVRILHDFGSQKTKEWAVAEFVTKGGTKVLGRTWRQGLRGLKFGPHRPDLALLDDLEDDEMVKNPERIKDLVKRVNEELLPSMDPHRGQVFLVGTFLAKKCALAIIMDNEEWIAKKYRAVADGEWNPEGLWSEERGRFIGCYTAGTPLWPARWDLDALSRERRIIGSPAFNKEYQNDPQDDESMFQDKWFRRIQWNAIPENLALYKFGGRDPSLRHGQSNDFKAHIVVARGGPNIYVLYASIKRFSLGRMIDEDFALVPRFGELQFGLEVESWQELLRDKYAEAAREKKLPHLPIVPITHHGVSKDDVARIGGLSSMYEAGEIIHCDGPVAEVGDMKLLEEQLTAFPSTTVNDDGPDAEQMAIKLARSSLGGKPNIERVERSGGARFGTGTF